MPLPTDVAETEASTLSARTVHVLVCSTFFKTNLMPAPVLWASPPVIVERTTSECIWQALAKCA
eukprot:6594310-Alexandrium_andersonii.AAC.1